MVNAEHRSSGKVYLVGAGPGDPELLTVKGRRALERCQVVIYDALVNPELLQYVAPEAERIFVGRPHERERLSQSEIERIMITRAREGKIVVRLKGGDPFIFGRGGEEAWALAEAGIDWEIIPGVSSGHAVPAYAGIPLTHRAYASSVAFVTGHECADKRSPVDWHRLAQAVDTIVIFMGVRNLARIVRALREGGRSSTTPIAIIEWGTYAEQRVHVGTLGTIL
ncbi:MAG: uroporphyrinogen-III C-methyltransferase, partial [Acidobacteria bacterium]